MRVRFTPRAQRDLSAILSYVVERSPQGARTVQRAIQQTIDFISQAPEGGRRSFVEDTRVLRAGRTPYLVYWSIESGEAWVVHIRHAARRQWKGRD
jgi:plasmid stabilization system protein ParE